MSRVVKRKADVLLDRWAEDLRRIEAGTPVLHANVDFLPDAEGSRGLLVVHRVPGQPDPRNRLMRLLVPARKQPRRMRLDAYGTRMVGLINGQRSTREIVRDMHTSQGGNELEMRKACLLFLRALARRSVLTIVEPKKRS